MAEEEHRSFSEYLAQRRVARFRTRQRYVGFCGLAAAGALAGIGALIGHQIAMIGSVTVAIVGHAFLTASYHDPTIPKP